MEKVIIIGSGPAGLTAAIYTARANLSPLIIGGYKTGGQLMDTTEVENYPGFVHGVMGPDLMMNMRQQAERFGARFVDKDVTSVDFSNPRVKKVVVEETEYEAVSVIIATGASAKWLEVPGEDRLKGRGISTCATCDGAFYRDLVVGVVGGGDSAMEEASFLTRFASKVYLIHRRGEFRASKIMQDRVMKNPKIEVVWNTKIVDVEGEQKLETVITENTQNGEKGEMKLDGIFAAIGHTPNTKFLEGQIDLDEKGYIKIPLMNEIESTNPEQITGHLHASETQTSVSGVFVAGDVYDIKYRQAITAAGSGCKAALDAERYLEGLE